MNAENGVSHVSEDYVKAIYAATEWGGEPVSVTGLAARMGVAASTASETVRRLADQGLLEHVPYAGVTLTESGRALALAVVRRHRLLETYLHDKLGFDWDQVHVEAEQLEHAVSERLIERIDAGLGHPRTDPHGDPIPSATGEVEYPPHVLLDQLEAGVQARVLRVSDRDPEVLRFSQECGIVPGVRVRVEPRGPRVGTVRVDVIGTDGAVVSRHEVGAPVARQVWVSV